MNKFNSFKYIKFKQNYPFHFENEIELNKLNIIAGMNNTGKSFMNKMIWAITFFYSIKIAEQNNNINVSEEESIKLMNFVLDNTFKDNNLNGSYEFTDNKDKSDYKIKILIENGIVTFLDFELKENTELISIPIYLSKEARSFGNLNKYLKMKKLLNISDISDLKNLESLTEFYKLYDIFGLENLSYKIKNFNQLLKTLNQLSSQTNENIFQSIGLDLKDIEFNEDKQEFICINSKGDKQNAETLGEGQQSMIMMVCSSL